MKFSREPPLLFRLQNLATTNSEKTEGIQISRWNIPGREGNQDEPIRLNVWDFGGQEIMHATHQFFLTRRSLYLVVLDARKGPNEGNLHYWLKIVQSYGGDAPVFVVINKCDEDPLELNETRLTKDYAPNIRGFFRTSCLAGQTQGADELRQAIEKEIRDLPHVFDEMPASWFAVKRELEDLARERDYLEIDEYRKRCVEHGVADAISQTTLLRFLHDLGGVLNFDDQDNAYHLKETNILNPEWVTGGVYKILNSVSIMKNRGVLKMDQVGDVLDDQLKYPEDRHTFILGMMRKFELCFDFPESIRCKLLIPELLPENEPELGLNEDDALKLEIHYDLLPGGILCRFIVKVHRHFTPKTTYWRSGVVLDIDGCRAIVRGDIVKSKVFISVAGPQTRRREALAIIRDKFQEIHATVPRITPREMIPLPDHPGVLLDYNNLRKFEEEGETTDKEMADDGTMIKFNISDVLDGVTSRDKRRSESMQRKEQFGAAPPPRNKPTPAPMAMHVDPNAALKLGIFGVFAFLSIILGLVFLVENVDSKWAVGGIASVSILVLALIFLFQMRSMGVLSEQATERLFGKILKLNRKRDRKD